MSEENPKIEELLKSVNDSVEKLDENEVAYKQSKETYTNKIQADLQQLSLLSGSQETLIETVNNLYWNTNIPTKYILSICVPEVGEIKNLIRHLTLKFPCRNNCGCVVKEKFTSRSGLADFTRNKRSEYSECSSCREKDKFEYKQLKIKSQKDTQRQYAEIAQRNEDLTQMTWNVFIETPEWATIRNSCFCDARGECEMCNAKIVTLYLYPHKDTPQSQKNYYGDATYKYYLLCVNCIKRCKGLISNKRREVIKTEVFPIIWEWAREVEYGMWD